MKSRFLSYAIMLLAFMACNKTDDTNPIIEKDPPNYFPMTTGSYWVYNTYDIDSLGNEELKGENDTIIITGDTIINGNTYKRFYGKIYYWGSPDESYYRDSSGYIVKVNGNIIFSNSNFSDTLYSDYIPHDTSANWHFYTQMEPCNEEIILPAGVFDSVLNYVFHIDYLELDEPRTDELYDLYAPNVGKIIDQYSYIGIMQKSKKYHERRLVDYYIAK